MNMREKTKIEMIYELNNLYAQRKKGQDVEQAIMQTKLNLDTLEKAFKETERKIKRLNEGYAYV